MAMEPRLCHLVKWPDFRDYGFNLHAEKNKLGQYIGKVDEFSPAWYAGLREGDRIVEVNGVNISNENHKQVVERIKSVPNETKLLVVDEAADKWYKERKIVIKSTQNNVIYQKTPSERPKQEVDKTDSTPSIDFKTSSTIDQVVEISNKPSHDKINNNNNEIVKNELHSGSSEILNDVTGISSMISLTNGSDCDDVKSNASQSSIRSNENDNRSMTDSPSFISTSSTDESAQNGSRLNLNLSASEMKKIISQRKKYDPKKVQMDLKEKYEIIQQL